MLIRDFKDPFHGRKGIFMFTSDHQLRLLVFRTADDFTFGVNTLAIGTLKFKVSVLCYTLMNNHFHLLVLGRYEDCLAYFRWVLLRLAQMLKARYGINGVLKADTADVPEDWEHLNGRILNKCFVDYRTVERLIESGLPLFDRVRKYDLESVVSQSHGIEEMLAFTDTEMQEKILAVCKNEYHVESHNQLGRKELLLLARTLAHRFSATKKQIVRLLGIDPAVLDNAL